MPSTARGSSSEPARLRLRTRREYTFLHILVRDVAYGQIPSGERAEKHRRAAEWIESLGRPDDYAETLAYHYLSALELARSSGQPTEELVERARVRSSRGG